MKSNFTKALVTGCAGFIGSNLIKSLIDKNYIVTGVDNFRTGQKKFIKNFFNKKNLLLKK